MNAPSRPQPASLRDALTNLSGVSGRSAAEALLRLQSDLLNAGSSRLVRLDGEATDPAAALAQRAALDGSVVQERREGGATIAVGLGDIDGTLVAAVHELERATPLALALAHERMELTAALYRALIRPKGSGWDEAAALVAAFSGAASRSASLVDAAKALQRFAGAHRVILASYKDGAVASVADSAEPRASAEHLARLKLVAGEVYDFADSRRAAGPLPPALRALAGELAASTALAAQGGRSIAVIALGAERPEILDASARLIVSARPAGWTLLPPALVAAAAERLPWPRTWSADKRRHWSTRAILASPLLLLLVPIPVDVTAAVAIQPLDQRIVTAPFDGRIEAVEAQPGDRVQAGRSVLVRLDARSALSERADVLANLQAALSQADAARIEGRSDDERLARLRAQQFAARAEILRIQIAAADIRAPIDGIVGGDDLRKRVGSPVSRGDTLFTVARPGRYRAEIRVPDRDIGPVASGDHVSLALKARPFDRPTATVTRIYPIAEVEEGENIFRVVAEIDDGGTTYLLPGMEGQASIRTGWAPAGWALLKTPVRWLRQKLWI